jgi:hypothetical protein
LGIVRAYFGVERFGHVVKGDAVVGLDHKYLLQPQFLLKNFNLRQEFNDLMRDQAEHLDLAQILFYLQRAFVLNIIQVHDLVL